MKPPYRLTLPASTEQKPIFVSTTVDRSGRRVYNNVQ
jgi:hypothetical protein